MGRSLEDFDIEGSGTYTYEVVQPVSFLQEAFMKLVVRPLLIR